MPKPCPQSETAKPTIDRVMFAPIWSTRVLIGVGPRVADHTTLRLHGLACPPHRVHHGETQGCPQHSLGRTPDRGSWPIGLSCPTTN